MGFSLTPSPDPLFDTHLDPVDLFNRAHLEVSWIHKRAHHLDEPIPQRHRSSAGASLDEHLSFPELSASGIVAFVPRKRHGQRPRLAIWTQTQINAIKEPLLGRSRQCIDQSFGKSREEFLIGYRPIAPTLSLTLFGVDEHQIDI